MDDKKIENNKQFSTKDILIAIFIMLVFITIVSAIFIKLATISYKIEKTDQEINQTKQNNKSNEKEIEEDKNEQQEKIIKYNYNKPELEESYTPIKFIWTENDIGYWVKTTKEDKEWYSIQEGIYPTFAYNPETTQMTFTINNQIKEYEVLCNWDYKIYIWISKCEEIKDNYEELFLKSEKGTLLLYDNSWENDYNQTYNRKQKIDILPKEIKEKITKIYGKYIENSENKNIEVELEVEEE